MLSLPHLLIVVVIVMVLFGAGRIPRLMEDLGKGVTSFKKGLNGDDEEKKPKQIEDKSDET